MGQPGLTPRNSQSRAGRVERRRSAPIDLAESSPEFERKWFELDRGIVIGQVSTLRRSITNGAKQMDMIAAEKIFDQPLSEMILRKAQALQKLARELKELAIKIAAATGYPKVDED